VSSAVLGLHQRTFTSLRRHRNYRLFFSGQVVSLAGSWMQNVALAWFVIELSNSPIAVGALAFCRFAPYTALGLVAGSIVDRFDTRRLVMATQAAAMVFSTALAVVVLAGVASLPVVLVLATLLGVAIVFDAPGRQALTYEMVGPNELPNAVALNSSLLNASRVVGPALAGLVIATLGVGVCFAVNAASFVAVLAALLLMDGSALHPAEKDRTTSLLGGVREAFGVVAASPTLRTVLTVIAIVSTVGFNFNVVLPLLASNRLHVGAEGFGLLSASFGAGAVVGALVVATRGRASWRAFLLGTAGFGVGMLLLAPVTLPWLAGVLLFAIGVCFTMLTSNATALVQLAAPGRLRGRAVGLYLFAFIGFAPLGGLVAGWLVDLGGTPLAFTVAGIVGLGTAAWAHVARSGVAPGAPSTDTAAGA
jgi:MFS family permease